MDAEYVEHSDRLTVHHQVYAETHPLIIWMGKTHFGGIEMSLDG